AGREDNLVEALVEEARVVPVGARDVGGRIHGILRRTAAPVGRAEGLGVPDLRPVAVARLALYLDVDAGGRGLLGEELGCVDGAGEGDFRGPQQDRALMARTLEIVARLVRIVGPLLDALGE